MRGDGWAHKVARQLSAVAARQLADPRGSPPLQFVVRLLSVAFGWQLKNGALAAASFIDSDCVAGLRTPARRVQVEATLVSQFLPTANERANAVLSGSIASPAAIKAFKKLKAACVKQGCRTNSGCGSCSAIMTAQLSRAFQGHVLKSYASSYLVRSKIRFKIRSHCLSTRTERPYGVHRTRGHATRGCIGGRALILYAPCHCRYKRFDVTFLCVVKDLFIYNPRTRKRETMPAQARS